MCIIPIRSYLPMALAEGCARAGNELSDGSALVYLVEVAVQTVRLE